MIQLAGTKYLEENYQMCKKTVIVNGKTKVVKLKHLDTKKPNLFNNVVKMSYHDYMSDIADGNNKINMKGILHYTNTDAAKSFFDEAYKNCKILLQKWWQRTWQRPMK